MGFGAGDGPGILLRGERRKRDDQVDYSMLAGIESSEHDRSKANRFSQGKRTLGVHTIAHPGGSQAGQRGGERAPAGTATWLLRKEA